MSAPSARAAAIGRGIAGAKLHERDHIGRTHPRVHAHVGSQVDALDGHLHGLGEPLDQVPGIAHAREHRAVVIGVGVDVEHPGVAPDGRRDRLDGRAVTTHGKVRHSLDQVIHPRKVPPIW